MNKQWLGRLTALLVVMAVLILGWVLYRSMQPSDDTLRKQTLELDLQYMLPQSAMTLPWRGARVLVYRRSEQQLQQLDSLGDIEGLFEEDYRHYWLDESQVRENAQQEFAVFVADRGGCDIELHEQRPAAVKAQHWAGGGFYSPCEDAWFDLSGRLYAEYRGRQREKTAHLGYWTPVFWLMSPPYSLQGGRYLQLGSIKGEPEN